MELVFFTFVFAGLFVFLLSSRRSFSPRPRLTLVTTQTQHGETTHYELEGKCYVVDGDTITIGYQNIRLAGIDAPELDHPYGKKSKWYLVSLTKGHRVRAVFHGEQSYTREVATCYLPDGRDLSAEMVKAGFAIDWPKFSGGKYRHLEPKDARKKMWRADARQKSRRLPHN